MVIVILLFGLIVGVMQISSPVSVEQVGNADGIRANVIEVAREVAAEPVTSSRTANTGAAKPSYAFVISRGGDPYAIMANTRSKAELNQMVADLLASRPAKTGNIVTMAMAQQYDNNTIGDVALIAAAATKAAPEHAVSIAAAVARSLKDAPAALSASIASIVVLVPEQSQTIATVVGAVVGDDAYTLGMIAQTVAISSGQEVFTGLSTGSGASVAAVMRQSSRLGTRVPFEVPAYAAHIAPQPSMFADIRSGKASSKRLN